MNRTIITIVGARPNFVKIASFLRALESQPKVKSIFLHTGQHYDAALSESLFEQLNIRHPDINLNVGSGTHAEQTGKVMIGFEKVLSEQRADCVVVVGDVNSTMACAIVAKKAQVKVAHIEAGLRSRDMAMPEEINRICTDVITDFLFTTTPEAGANLRSEGVPADKIHFVGNIMIDSLVMNRERAAALKSYETYGLKRGEYALVTLHRPSNVDNEENLRAVVQSLAQIHRRCPVLFLAHPRTQGKLKAAGLLAVGKNPDFCKLAESAAYLDMLNLQMNAKFVITDSGGIQEETTVLGIPCLTYRENTERPETVSAGTNILVGTDPSKLLAESGKILSGDVKRGQVPELWDGKTGERIVQVLRRQLSV